MSRFARHAAAVLAATVVAVPAGATQLLSLQDFPVGPNEYVEAFSIDTFGVLPRAVCHIPYGWIVTAGVDGTPVGSLSGQAGHGANALNTAGLEQLKQLFLIDDLNRIETARPEHPATFAGRILIGTYAVDAEPVWRRLKAMAYALSPAPRCP